MTVDLGPTYLVPQDFTRGMSLSHGTEREKSSRICTSTKIPLTVEAGSTVIYSMNTFHRGSAMRAGEGLRFSHHTGFKASGLTWCGQVTFQHDGGTPEMDRFLETATPEQRELVGFPPIGDPYWDEAHSGRGCGAVPQYGHQALPGGVSHCGDFPVPIAAITCRLGQAGGKTVAQSSLTLTTVQERSFARCKASSAPAV